MIESWNLRNGTLKFDEETHTYWWNDKKCISVTQLLKHKFPRKYEGISEEVLKKAAEKGTAVHESIEIYEKYGLDSNELLEFRNYLFLKSQFKFETLANEIPIVIIWNDLVVAGRLDMVVREYEKTGLADIKSTSQFDKEYLGCQLNLYKIGYEQTYGEQVEFLRGIHLKNNNRKYAVIPINEQLAIELLEKYKGEKQ